MQGHMIFKKKTLYFFGSRNILNYFLIHPELAFLATGTIIDTWQVRRGPHRGFSNILGAERCA